jgi:hypothetical protein
MMGFFNNLVGGTQSPIDKEINDLKKVLNRNNDVKDQINAIKKLGELKAKSAIDALVKVAMGETINTQSTDMMGSLQARLNIGSLRDAVAEALGEIGDAKAITPLIALMKAPDSGSCDIFAKMALIKIGEPSVLPLIAALNINDLSVRQKAAQALGEIGDKRALDPLKRVGESDDNPYVRGSAIESIEKIEKKPVKG